eukprot:m.173547 g.173547  ORF g.173547 m.173547 type:complete len:122 (-) comp16532_c1_seq2:104-469(-)
MLDLLLGGTRLNKPIHCPVQVYAVMRDCWLEQESKRPSFPAIITRINKLSRKHIHPAADDTGYSGGEEIYESINMADEEAGLRSTSQNNSRSAWSEGGKKTPSDFVRRSWSYMCVFQPLCG